jgi:two-component system, response regulator YesN
MRSLIVAEDEELFRHELATATPWEEYGFVLAGEAADGEEAWRLVLERKPDVLLADIRMPGLDGLSLLERITSRLREEEAPMTVFLTGHSEFEYARKALRLGAFDYLLKPLDDAELKDVLRRVAAALDERDKSSILADAASSNPALAFFSAYAPGRDRDPSAAYVEKAVGEIAARYVTSLNAEEVAHRLGISDGYLARLFKAKTGLTFAEYLTRYRMMRAIELLKDQTVRIGEVADLVGYRDQRHFSVLFRRLVGLTPTQFREGRLREGKKEVEKK